MNYNLNQNKEKQKKVQFASPQEQGRQDTGVGNKQADKKWSLPQSCVSPGPLPLGPHVATQQDPNSVSLLWEAMGGVRIYI